IDVRFALSYDALKMNGKFSERATPLTISAMRSACSSLSITQGPAMRNRSPEPTRTLSIWNERVKIFHRRDAEHAEKTENCRSLASLGMTILIRDDNTNIGMT